MTRQNKKKKEEVFNVKTFQFSGVHSLLVGLDGFGVLKVRYTEEVVTVTIWDDKCENILHEFEYSLTGSK